MVRRFFTCSFLVAATSALFGCSGADDPEIDRHPTFHRDVEPILQRSCQSCHASGGLAPFALESYEDARAVVGPMVAQTAARTMPPWGSVESDECRPSHGWKNDVRLSDAELRTIAAWRDDGTPEGDVADAPEKVETVGDTLPGVQQELTPKAPFVTEGDADQFECFVLDPGLTSDAWVNGIHVVPGNRAVVHHAVIIADPERSTEALADANGRFDCFSMGTDAKAIPLTVWLPGGAPFELPANIGMPVPAKSLIVLQIHYHPAGSTAAPDTTRVQLRYTAGKPEYLLAPVALGNFTKPLDGGDGLQPGPDDGASGPEFRIPAGVADHVEQMRLTIPATSADGSPLPDVRIYGAGAHMHMIGHDLLAQIERVQTDGSVASECLLHEPHWNFDWQRSYAYDAPIEELPALRAGDKVDVRCTYDNSLANPFVQRALHDAKLQQPIDVFLGEETLDEMCLAILPLLVKAP